MSYEEWIEAREAEIAGHKAREAVATFVRDERWLLTTAKLYRLSEPLRWYDDPDEGVADYVVVSASHAEYECIAWVCDKDGNFIPDDNRCSVAHVRGTIHDEAVRALGYRVEVPLVTMQAAGGPA